MSSASAWSPFLGPVHASPFTQAVVRAMRKLYVFFLFLYYVSDYYAFIISSSIIQLRYPESLADKTFDNTGCEHSLGHLGYFVQGGFSFGNIMSSYRYYYNIPKTNSFLINVCMYLCLSSYHVVKKGPGPGLI